MKRGQIRERKRDSFEREKQLQNIERERRGKIIVIFARSLESVFHIATADSLTIGSDLFLDSMFYTCDTSNCLIGLSKRYLEGEISISHVLVSLKEFIFAACYFVVEFVIVLTCFFPQLAQ